MGIQYEKTGQESFEVGTKIHAVEVGMSNETVTTTIRDSTSGEVVVDAVTPASEEFRMGGIHFYPTSRSSFILRLPDACIEADASGGTLSGQVWDTPWPTADEQPCASFENENAFSL